MKKYYRFGCEDWEDFEGDANSGVDLRYTNKEGLFWEFHLETGGYGYELYDCENDIDYEYHNLEELYENHIMPDGVSFKDAYNGENYLKEE